MPIIGLVLKKRLKLGSVLNFLTPKPYLKNKKT